MTELIEAIADFSSMRERESLNFALVKLLAGICQQPVEVVRLVRAVGEPGDKRWECLAELVRGDEEPRRDKVWAHFSILPRVGDYPDRQACLLHGSAVHLATTPDLLLIPVETTPKGDLLLELQSEEPLDMQTASLIKSILRIYSNVLGLLDYSERDSLTELLNRKTFDGAFIAATQQNVPATPWMSTDRRNQRSGTYWLAVMDIDHFKRVNDAFGHLIGDEVLVLLARLMRQCFRYNDLLYRFGGEEFVVLMRCADDADAQAALERFRTLVEAREFPQIGHVTVSVGYAPLVVDDTPSAAFERADNAVYYAKSNGRNQVCSYTDLVARGELQDVSSGAGAVDFF